MSDDAWVGWEEMYVAKRRSTCLPCTSDAYLNPTLLNPEGGRISDIKAVSDSNPAGVVLHTELVTSAT